MMDDSKQNASVRNEGTRNGSPHNDGMVRDGSARNRRRSRVAVIIAIFLLIYIPSAFNWFSNRSVRTDILREGTLSEAIYTNAVVVRDEELIYADRTGILVPAVNEGDRVQGNAVVATVYDDTSAGLLEQLKEAGGRLLEMQYEAQTRTPVYSQAVESIEYEITGAVNKMIPELNHNSLTVASARVDAIGGLLKKRAEAYGRLGTDDAGVAALKEEVGALEAQADETGIDIYCEAAGHLSFAIDGRERELTPMSVSTITAEYFDELVAGSNDGRPDKTDIQFDGYGANSAYDGVSVTSGEPSAKVVKGNSFLLVVGITDGGIGRFAAGDSVSLRVEAPYHEFNNVEILAVYDGNGVLIDGNGNPADASGAAGGGDGIPTEENGAVTREGGSGRGFIVVSLSKYLYDFLTARTVSVALIERYQEGLKVPVKCLRDIDTAASTADIVLVKGTYASVRRVRILASNGVYAIIESGGADDPAGRIARYDTYVRDTTNIEDGMPLPG